MRKRLMAFVVTLAMLVGMFPFTVMADTSTPIATPQDFAAMTADGNFQLTEDITITVPWGSQDLPFMGVFDGNGHTITLALSDAANYQGAFARIGTEGHVKNLTAKGSIYMDSTNKKWVGGITGKNEGLIEKCLNFTSIKNENKTKTQYYGGIAGQNSGGTIRYCSNEASISAGDRIGGITGYNYGGTLYGCVNNGVITALNGLAGGIAGISESTNSYLTANLYNCYNLGAIQTENSYSYAAGICAQINQASTIGAKFVLSNCYNRGVISSPSGVSQPSGEIFANNLTLNKDGVTLSNNYSSSEVKNEQSFIDVLNASTNAAAEEYFIAGQDVHPILAWQKDASGSAVLVTGAAIEGIVKSGQTVTAIATPQNAGNLSYQWQMSEDGISFSSIPNESEESYQIPDDGKSLQFLRVIISGDNNSSAASETMQIDGVTHAENQAAVEAAKIGLSSPSVNFGSVIRSNLSAASLITSPVYNGITLHISWQSSHPDIIKVTGSTAQIVQPETGDNVDVTLTGTITAGSATSEKSFIITVVSKENTDGDSALYLENAAKALGNSLSPVCGQNSNLLDMAKLRLAQGFSEASISIQSVGTAKDAAITTDGAISYFYHDPEDKGNFVWSALIPVTFTISKGDDSINHTLNAVIGWDCDKVEKYLQQKILNQLSISEKTDSNLELPRYLGNKGGKTWVEISWSSSNSNVISISSELQQGSADALYNPYVGKVHSASVEQQASLTATATFNRTSPIYENKIIATKVFPVSVNAINGQDDTVLKSLQEKLDAGFSKVGLRNAVTGERLTPAQNDIYYVSDDILFPTTRDFDIDGKYYPVKITSSNLETIVAPDVSNASRVTVYRPGMEREAKEVRLELSITDLETGKAVSKTFKINVAPLTEREVQDELSLMNRVKQNYFNGIRNENVSANQITSNLRAFQEASLNGDELVWIYDVKEKSNHGIVPVAMDGWYDLQTWRLFKSSNPSVISHENMLVTRAENAKSVSIQSALSSEIFGKYGELYKKDPVKYSDYASLAGLYYQEISADLIVRGTKDPNSEQPVEEKLTVSFTLQAKDKNWIPATILSDLEEESTVFDVFKKLLSDNGYTYTAKGSYIESITSPDNVTLAAFSEGENSGWMYKVNDVIVNSYMADYTLHDKDKIFVFFTQDYTKEEGHGSGGNSSGGSSSGGGSGGKSSGGTTTSPTTETKLPEKQTDATVIKVKLDEKKSKMADGSVKTTIPNVKAGQIIMVVNADGTETILKKAVIEETTAYLVLKENATLKFIEKSDQFKDVSEKNWYHDAVSFVVQRQIFSGKEKDSFAPDDTMTRGMLASVLYRLENEPQQATGQASQSFKDIASGSWYTDAVLWASSKNIVAGNGDNTFTPNQSITREQLVSMLYRYAKAIGMDTSAKVNTTEFNDWSKVHDYAQEAMSWAAGSGLIQGRNQATIAPDATATRAEVAAMTQRLVTLMVK